MQKYLDGFFDFCTVFVFLLSVYLLKLYPLSVTAFTYLIVGWVLRKSISSEFHVSQESHTNIQKE